VEYFFSTMKNLVDISQAPKLIHDFFGLACLIYNINDHTKISCPEDYAVTGEIISSINEFDARHAKTATDLYRHYLLTGHSLLISSITFNNVYFGHIVIVENADQILDDDMLEDALR
jgi:bifunctional N-acetylglucosamine-1-phosphate-uridyltransferase/glucosamine-1-phosphate-acetyltransferase GlmU-like protein